MARPQSLIPALLVLVLIAGCQPSPEERVESAKLYMAEGNYRAAAIELKNALRATPNNEEARSLIAQSAYQMADFPAAIDDFARALELGGDSTENWIGLGESLLRSGKAAEALDRVVPNLDQNSTNTRELALIADVYASLGNYDGAIGLFNRLLNLDSEAERGLIGLASIAASRRDFDLADEMLDKATHSDQASSRAFLIQGHYKRLRRDYAGAAAAFESAIDNENLHTNIADRFDTRAALATTSIDRKEIELARSTVEDLARIFPGHPLLNFLRGRIAFAEGDLSLASTELQEYLSRAPKDLKANVVIGAVNFYQGYYSQAEMYLQQAVRSKVGGDAAVRLLAETRLRLNRPQETLELLRGAGIDNNDVSVLGLLGRAEFRSGNRDAGLEYFEQGATADPDQPEIQLMYAMALMSDGQNEKAVEVLESLPDYDDVSHRKEMFLLAALERNGERKKAEEFASEFLSANSEESNAHALMGSFKRGIGEPEQAIEHFKGALKIDGSNYIALFGLASLAKDRGDAAEAERFLVSLLDARPSYMPGLAMLAEILLPAARLEDLRTRVEGAVTAAPQSSGPRLLRARVALASGDPDAAMSYIRDAREIFPDLPALRHLEGIVLIRLGQIESALISLTRAATAEPTNARFQFDLAVARLQAKDHFGAAKTIDVYRSLRPSDPVGLSIYVSALIGQRNYDDARKEVDKFEFTASNGAIGDVLRGDIDLAEGLAAEAVSHFEVAADSMWDRGIALRLSSAYLAAGSSKAPQPLARWLSDNPGDVLVRRSYGELLQSSGASDEAIREYEKVVAANANDAIALNNLAWEYSLSGRREAVTLAKRAYDLEPNHANIVDTYAWILFLNDDVQNALPLAKKAVVLDPENGNITYHLARILADTGERQEAAGMIKKLLESDQSFSSRADALKLAESL